MSKLRNLPGTTVISKSKSSGPGYVVLAEWRRGEIREYVTWITDRLLNCFWGHYFSELAEAREDYKDRVQQYC